MNQRKIFTIISGCEGIPFNGCNMIGSDDINPEKGKFFCPHWHHWTKEPKNICPNVKMEWNEVKFGQ